MWFMPHTIESLEAHLRLVGRDMLRDGCSEHEVRLRFRAIVALTELDVEGVDDPMRTWLGMAE